MNDSTKNELYLVDGSGFIFRAYYAMAYGRGGQTMTNAEGTPVSAVYGYTNMILKLLRDYHAPYLAVVFDTARKNFRNDIYPEYKANRQETPEDLIPQFPLIREATSAFDIPCIELEGFEADDLIAAYAKQATARGLKVVIVSSDKDLMQLLNENVRMLDPMKNKFLGREDVIEKFGVPPEKVIDVQSLIGDPTDNIPGIPGIGVKTAAQLITEYGSLEELLSRAHEIKQDKRRQLLIEHADKARLSSKLVRLDDGAPMPIALEDLKTHDPNKPELMAFLQKHGFKSIIQRLGGLPAPEIASSLSLQDAKPAQILPKDPPPSENIYTLINDEEILKQWIAKAYETGLVVIDTETTSLTPAKAELVGIAMASTVGKAAYIPLKHAQNKDLLGEASDGIKQLPTDLVLSLLKPLLEDPSVLKIAHNMKYDRQMFAARGIRIHPCDDTMLMSYVLDGTAHSHSMDNLSKLYFNYEPIPYEAVAGKGKSAVTFDYVPIDKALEYAAEDADITLRLYHALKPRLAQEKMASVYELIERPLIPVIAQMELAGIKVDPLILKNLSDDFGKKLHALEGEIHALAGHTFNVSSPKQVSDVLFKELGLEGGKKTKSGDSSTSVEVLEKLAAQGHKIAEKILEHRQLSKLKSTYTDALQEQIHPKTGRVHTSFAMAHTNTGRLSSSDPNLQNIPIRTEEGRKIRTAFVAEKGHVLLSVDYSQVELRLAAEIAGIAALKEAFKNKLDIHTLTAAQVFGLPLEEVTPDIRRQAKAVNFGIIYGISGWGLAKQLGCDPADANEFIRKYLARFPELQNYMQDKKAEAKQNGFVKTLYGRKCVIDGAKDSNPARRGFAERQAINAPLQGTAADIMKIAMGKIPAALARAGLKTKMLLQVHDELVFEVPDEEIEPATAIIREIMENSHKIMNFCIDVPLDVEAGSATSWAQAH